MTTINTKLPDTLFRQAKSIADREEISFDQFVALAVASQISAWQVGQDFKTRAARGSWARASDLAIRPTSMRRSDSISEEASYRAGSFMTALLPLSRIYRPRKRASLGMMR